MISTFRPVWSLAALVGEIVAYGAWWKIFVVDAIVTRSTNTCEAAVERLLRARVLGHGSLGYGSLGHGSLEHGSLDVAHSTWLTAHGALDSAVQDLSTAHITRDILSPHSPAG